MIGVAVKEFENRLSAYLREVVADLVVLSTDQRVRDNARHLGFAVLPD